MEILPPSLHLPVENTISQCIKCNICVSACPVAAVTDKFPGPKYEAPQAGRYRQAGKPSPDYSVDFCSGCRVCNIACPTGVRIAEINARARSRMVDQGKIPPIHRIRNNILARPELLAKIINPIAPLANIFLDLKPIRWFMHHVLMIHKRAPIPKYSHKRFSPWFNRYPQNDALQKQIVYFHGCSVQYYEPHIGKTVVRVLNALGYKVIVPRQNCCGLPLLSNGEFAAARNYHQQNISHLLPYVREGIPIIGSSTSCTLTLKEEANELLDMSDNDALLVAKGTYDLSEFILIHIERSGHTPKLSPIPITVIYHEPCQYRAHGLGHPGIDMISSLPEICIIESPIPCCGIAGTYGYKREKYEIAMDIGRPLFELSNNIDNSIILSESETCRWHIAQATKKPVFHPIQLYALSMGIDVPGLNEITQQSINEKAR